MKQLLLFYLIILLSYGCFGFDCPYDDYRNDRLDIFLNTRYSQAFVKYDKMYVTKGNSFVTYGTSGNSVTNQESAQLSHPILSACLDTTNLVFYLYSDRLKSYTVNTDGSVSNNSSFINTNNSEILKFFVKDSIFFTFQHTQYSEDKEVQILEIDQSDNLNTTATFDLLAPKDIALQNQYIFIADYTNGIYVYDVSNPYNPIKIKHILEVTSNQIELSGNHLISLGENMVTVFDISDINNIKKIEDIL
ncbi:MAG: hypothetical protein R2766_11150 [Saprospiraceae bacterium]